MNCFDVGYLTRDPIGCFTRPVDTFINYVRRPTIKIAQQFKAVGVPTTRRLHSEELNDLYSLPNIVWVVKSRRMRWAGHVERMGEDRGVHRVLVGKPEGKRPLGRPRYRWEDNIKMDLQEVGGGRGDDGVGSG